MAPTPARQPGAYGQPFSMRSSPMGVAWDGELTTKGVSGGSGDRSSARDRGRLVLIFGDGGSSRWGLFGDKK
jgi:hypothetical protein